MPPSEWQCLPILLRVKMSLLRVVFCPSLSELVLNTNFEWLTTFACHSHLWKSGEFTVLGLVTMHGKCCVIEPSLVLGSNTSSFPLSSEAVPTAQLQTPSIKPCENLYSGLRFSEAQVSE